MFGFVWLFLLTEMKLVYQKLRKVLIGGKQLKSCPLVKNCNVCLPELCEESMELCWVCAGFRRISLNSHVLFRLKPC